MDKSPIMETSIADLTTPSSVIDAGLPSERRPVVAARLDFEATRILTADQVLSWREKGFCVIHPKGDRTSVPSGWLMTKSEAERFRIAARTAVLGDGQTIKPLPDVKNFGGIGFPFFARKSEPLNELVLHHRLIGAVRELLGLRSSETPLLSQAECWVKRDASASADLPAEFVNTDQRMHCDYPNHYLTHPPPWDQPEAVAMIVYLDDGEECGGGTAYVPREGEYDEAYAYPYVNMPGVGNLPWLNDRQSAENYIKRNSPEDYDFRKRLYDREERVQYRIGTTLVYRLDLWHRGTPLHPDKDRAVVNLLYKKSDAKHITSWHRGWATNAYNTWAQPRVYPPQLGRFEEFLSIISPEERALLGFPKPGDSFWTTETIRAVGSRYPRMDMRPYTNALARL